MARTVTITQAGTGTSDPKRLDSSLNPFSIGIATVLVSGTATWTVEHSYDDPDTTPNWPTGATWFAHAVIAGKSANTDGSYSAPVQAIRLNVTAGTGTVKLMAVQGNAAR